jgi:Fic family protein
VRSCLNQATKSLNKLNKTLKENKNLSLYTYIYVRREALFSCQIEGTKSSFSDLILFEHHQKTSVSIDDVEEVSNYVMAINYGLERIKKGFPVSLQLLREIHGVLLNGRKGTQKLPEKLISEFRSSQNWIGGTGLKNALFIPPSPEHMTECLSDFENFLQDKESKIHPLLRAGLAHIQFETIHPFLNENGKLGRILIILILYESEILNEPMLYLSLYLHQNRSLYFYLLQEIRTHGTWETWLDFFLKAVHNSAEQAISLYQKINKLFEEDFSKIEELGLSKSSCIAVFEHLKKLPQASISLFTLELNITKSTVKNTLNRLIQLGILEEVSGKQRNKIFVYKKYLNLLSEIDSL